MCEVDSPFRSPNASSMHHFVDERQAIYRIARYRQWVGWAFAGTVTSQFVALICGALWNYIYNVWEFPGWLFPSYVFVYLISVLSIPPIILFSVVSGFALTRCLTNSVVATVTAILICIPVISLVTLLLLIEFSNQMLRKEGLEIGQLGSSARNIFKQLQRR